jgi:hypothetical protein
VFDLGVSFGTFILFSAAWVVAYFLWAYLHRPRSSAGGPRRTTDERGRGG